MKIRFFLFAFIIFIFSLNNLTAFDIQFPNESGFYIGKPMMYVITGTAGDPKTVGQEGVYSFGPIIVIIDGGQYYNCIFQTDDGIATFFLGIDNNKKIMTQKSVKFNNSELDINPAITTLKYPLFTGQTWDNKNEKTKIVAKNISFNNIKLPDNLTIENVTALTTVSPTTIKVPAGTFETLLVETVYNGFLIGIPTTITQRTWMSEDNVPVKRSFEFSKPTKMIIYEIELTKPNPNIYDLNWDGVVNVLDIMLVTKYYGMQIKSSRIPNPDLNKDSVVDLGDIEMIISHFGKIYKK